MRLKLKKGQQKRLIKKFKEEKNLTWNNLSEFLGIKYGKLKSFFDETSLITEELYQKIDQERKFSKYIIEKKEEGWGKIKGGLNSPGSTKKIRKISFDEKLSEFVGIVLGDGHVGLYKKGKKIGVYCIRIAGDLKKDQDYHINYIKKLFQDLFNLRAKEVLRKKNNERFLDFYSKELVNLFIEMGIKPGNKIKNQSTIPKWIFSNKSYLKVCLRGLIDTDGSIFRMSKKDYKLIRINFTNHNITLLNDVRRAFLNLGFHPSKIINNRQFHISRQKEIKRYVEEIGFKNLKHIQRLKEFSPIF